MFSTKWIYCDFFLWTEKEIHIADDQFRHNNVVNYVSHFLLEPFYLRCWVNSTPEQMTLS